MSIGKLCSVVTFAMFAICTIDARVENSIIPTMEKYETIENLNPAKFSRNQFKEIGTSLSHLDEKIRIVSYNVLFNIYDHNLDEVNRWPQRLPRIVAQIEEMQPDIIGVQELYPSQLTDLMPHLDHTYAFFSRECENNELNGIFYRKDRFKVIDSQILSMTGTLEDPGSDNLTMLQLEDIKTGKQLGVFNTHMAFSKVDKRDAQARFIAELLEVKSSEFPVVFTGDLNTFPSRMDLTKLPFYDGDYVHRILTQGCLRDAKDVSVLGHVGPISTFSNQGEDSQPFKGNGTPGVFLDHIYVSQGAEVLIHAVQPGTVEGHYPSDHLPVLMDCVVK